MNPHAARVAGGRDLWSRSGEAWHCERDRPRLLPYSL